MAVDEKGENGLSNVLRNLSLHEKSAISIKKVEDDYVLDIAVQNGSKSDRCIAATSSDYSIRLYKQDSLANVGSLTGHSNVVTGVTFSNTDTNTLYSSSLDSCIKCWDLRTSKCIQQLEGPSNLRCEFSSLGANSNDFIVCAGTEKSKKDDDVHILFWDRRKGEFLGSYCESHEDDVTQVCFHPSDPNKLATGSTDGLVCMFDISQDSEDDAILFTFNSDSSVSKVGWCGSEASNLYCTTHIDTLHVWDTDQGDDILEIRDAKERLEDELSIDYIVDCFYDDQLYLVAGTHSGDIEIFGATDDLYPVATLQGGHTATVRCSYWDKTTKSLITGGEDSLLCLWCKEPSLGSKENSSKLGQTMHRYIQSWNLVSAAVYGQKVSETKLKMKKSVAKKSKPY